MNIRKMHTYIFTGNRKQETTDEGTRREQIKCVYTDREVWKFVA